jgi:hypothetical protein
MPSSGTLFHEALVRAKVSDEPIASIISTKETANYEKR